MKRGVREEAGSSRSAASDAAAGPGSKGTEDFPLDAATRSLETWKGRVCVCVCAREWETGRRGRGEAEQERMRQEKWQHWVCTDNC